MKPERVYGVDFSGAEKAGNKIWIAGGEIFDTTLRISVCQPAKNLSNSGVERERSLAALRAFVTKQAPCVVGLDFPFGLPEVLVEEDRWEDFALGFGGRYPDAEAFREACRDVDGGEERKRVTDIESATPFSPYNLWIFRQTFHGIREVLAPLVDNRKVSVLPMQPATPGRAWLLEICPASTLKRMGLSMPYKKPELANERQHILSAILEREPLMVPERMRDTIIFDKEGDALDSIIAAAATFRALRESIVQGGPDEPGLVEGRVYV